MAAIDSGDEYEAFKSKFLYYLRTDPKFRDVLREAICGDDKE